MRPLIRAASLLLFSARLFAIDPIPGVETAVAPQTIGVSASLTSPAQAAASPTGYFVAWIDSSEPLGTPRLVGSRISRDGELVDFFGITIAEVAPGSDVRVWWNGSDYVVVSGAQTWLVGLDGTVRASGTQPRETFETGLAGETVVVKADGNTTFSYVATNGTRTNTVILSSSELSVKALLPVESDWVLLATDPADNVRWFKVNRQGLVLSNIIATGASQRSFAASRSQFVVSWVRSQQASANEDLVIFGYTLIDARNGIPSDEFLETSIVPRGTSPYTTTPVALFGGLNFAFISTHFEDGEHSIRVRSTSDDVRTIFGSDALHPITAMTLATGEGNLLVWRMTQPRAGRSGSSLFAIPFELSDDLELQPQLLLTNGPATQLQPRAAAGTNGILTAWREVGEMSRITARFRPFSGDAPEAVPVSAGTGETDAHAVAANDDTFVVVWRELDFVPLGSGPFATRMRIAVSRYDADGEPLDEEPVIIADMATPGSTLDSRSVSVIEDGSAFIVAWVGAGGRLYTTRFAARGPIFASVRTSDESPIAGPVLVRLNGRVVVIWNTTSLRAAPLNGNLVLETPVTLLDAGDIVFSAAAHEDELLVAWSARNGSSCLRTRRFNGGLFPIEPARDVVCDAASYTSATASDGARWWVSAASTAADLPLRAWRLGTDGAPEAVGTIVPGAQRPIDPELLLTPSGLLAVYSRLDKSSEFTWRAFLRPIIQKIRGRAVRH